MGAKSSRQGRQGTLAGKASVYGAKLDDGARARSTSMPDMANASRDVNFAPNGKETREKMSKRASHDHVIVSRKRTPPPDYHRDPYDVRQGYKTVTEQMVKIWPSYKYLKQFELNDVDLELVEKITQVFRHLLDQRDLIQTLSADNKRINGMIRDYKEEKSIQRKSMPPKTAADRRDSGEALKNKSTTLPANRQTELVRNDPKLDPKLKLMVEVQKMREQALISTSKRKSLDQQSSFDEPGSNSPIRLRKEDQQKIEELTAKVKSLQEELTKERRKRLSSASGAERSKHQQTVVGEDSRNESCLRIIQEYARLDKVMMTDIKAELDSAHKGVDDRMKYAFMCTVIQESKKVCEAYRERLEKSLTKLLLHPMEKRKQTKDDKKDAQRTSVLQNISKFESAGQTKKPDQIRQYIEENKLPSTLQQDAVKFVASISEHIDFNPVIQEVKEHLKQKYPTILTDSLCANMNVKKYLTDCCKVTWGMTIIDPQMRMDATPDAEFDKERHVPFRSQNNKDAKVDFFLWPVLYDDFEKLNSVVGKGRVALLKS